jgi:hypothetical protein
MLVIKRDLGHGLMYRARLHRIAQQSPKGRGVAQRRGYIGRQNGRGARLHRVAWSFRAGQSARNLERVSTSSAVAQPGVASVGAAAYVRAARPASTARLKTRARWFCSDLVLTRLTQPFQGVAAARRPCIPQAHPLVRPRQVARPRHLAAPDPPHLGERVRRGATRPRGDQGGAGAGAASDARDARGVDRFGQGHGLQNGGQAPNPPGSARGSVGMGAHQLVRTALVQPRSGTHRQHTRRPEALTVQVACHDSLTGLQKFADGGQEIIRIIFKDHMGGLVDFHDSGAWHGFQHLPHHFRA